LKTGVILVFAHTAQARITLRYGDRARYAPWSGASPRLLIVARVASIDNGVALWTQTLDTEHATEEPCQARIKKEKRFHDTSRTDGCPSTC
jgi:hypothetical protein